MLADLDAPSPAGPVAEAEDVDDLVRRKRLEQLRIAARDLLGLDDLEATTAALAELAADVLRRLARWPGSTAWRSSAWASSAAASSTTPATST